jgi:hypothetical protein
VGGPIGGERLGIGVIGGGLVAQAVHLPTLALLDRHFSLEAIADPSERVREAARSRHRVARGYADWRDLLADRALDAVAVCSPTGTHAEIVVAALQAGLHVFVEKPLSVTVSDAELICLLTEQVGRVVQVGYMKRYDPAYELLLSRLPRDASALRFIDVLTYDPGLARPPFVREDLVVADDIPVAVVESTAEALRKQVRAAVGADDDVTVRGFATGYLAALIHDVNLVGGVLEHLGVASRPAAVTSWHSVDARVVSATATLEGFTWHCTWLLLAGLATYKERASFLFDNQVHELELSAPYLRAIPGRCRVIDAFDGIHRTTAASVPGDAYEREWLHFHSCVVDGVPCRTPPEQALGDIVFLRDLFLAQ